MIIVTIRAEAKVVTEAVYQDRFLDRIHYASRAPGFIRCEVHRPIPLKFSTEENRFIDDPDGESTYEVKSWWRSIEDFVMWTRSDQFVESHNGRLPSEVFAVPGEVVFHEAFLRTEA